MTPLQWNALDSYFDLTLRLSDPVLDDVLSRCRAAGLPAHEVAPNQGRILQLFAQMAGARRILEIGTLGGYSAICMARVLPRDGRLVTLEADEGRVRVARENIALAGLQDRIDVIHGDAGLSLAAMAGAGEAPFDMVFIDADKAGNPAYLQAALDLTRKGAVIIGDNIIRAGRLLDEDARHDPDVQGARTFLRQMGSDPRLAATALQTVGCKGWDGFALAVVR
jgi:predicted O-methyltransferase YrrM